MLKLIIKENNVKIRKLYYLIMLLTTITLTSCDTGDSDNQIDKKPKNDFDWGVISVNSYSVADLGSDKQSILKCYPKDDYKHEGFIGINSINNQGDSGGYIYKYSDEVGCLKHPYIIKHNNDNNKSIIPTITPSVQQYYEFEINSMSNRIADNIYSSIAIYQYPDFAQELYLGVLNASDSYKAVADFGPFKFKAGFDLEAFEITSNSRYLFTSPISYENDQYVLKMLIQKEDNQYDVVKFGNYDNFADKMLGTAIAAANNGIVIGYDADLSSKADPTPGTLFICNVNKTVSDGSALCHLVTGMNTYRVDRNHFVRISENGKYIYALKRKVADKKLDPDQLVSIDPYSYNQTILPLTGVGAVLAVFDNGDAIIADSYRIYYFSLSKRVLQTINQLLSAAKIPNSDDYYLANVSYDGKYFLFYNKKINEKSTDRDVLYQLIKIK